MSPVFLSNQVLILHGGSELFSVQVWEYFLPAGEESKYCLRNDWKCHCPLALKPSKVIRRLLLPCRTRVWVTKDESLTASLTKFGHFRPKAITLKRIGLQLSKLWSVGVPILPLYITALYLAHVFWRLKAKVFFENWKRKNYLKIESESRLKYS